MANEKRNITMPSLALVRAQVEERLPGALRVYRCAERELIATGIAAVDRILGGIPRGGLTQLCADPKKSSGKTSLLLSLLAQVTRKEQFCALVDAGDCFDPASAEAAGVCLSRLLWVRCARGLQLKPLEQAFKATDILVQNGGFALIAVDLGNIEEEVVRRVPLTTWFRFARVVEKMPAALLFLVSSPVAQTCAHLTLHLDSRETYSKGEGTLSHSQILSAMDFDFEIGRTRSQKPAQSVMPSFQAVPQWA
jgi:hypothetical protein